MGDPVTTVYVLRLWIRNVCPVFMIKDNMCLDTSPKHVITLISDRKWRKKWWRRLWTQIYFREIGEYHQTSCNSYTYFQQTGNPSCYDSHHPSLLCRPLYFTHIFSLLHLCSLLHSTFQIPCNVWRDVLCVHMQPITHVTIGVVAGNTFANECVNFLLILLAYISLG